MLHLLGYTVVYPPASALVFFPCMISTLKKEAILSSETSVYVPIYTELYSGRWQLLKLLQLSRASKQARTHAHTHIHLYVLYCVRMFQ
jgi:hypothetical protein